MVTENLVIYFALKFLGIMDPDKKMKATKARVKSNIWLFASCFLLLFAAGLASVLAFLVMQNSELSKKLSEKTEEVNQQKEKVWNLSGELTRRNDELIQLRNQLAADNTGDPNSASNTELTTNQYWIPQDGGNATDFRKKRQTGSTSHCPLPQDLANMAGFIAYRGAVESNVNYVGRTRSLEDCYNFCLLQTQGFCDAFNFISLQWKCSIPDPNSDAPLYFLLNSGATAYLPAAKLTIDQSQFSLARNVLILDGQTESLVNRNILAVYSAEQCRALCDLVTTECRVFSFDPSNFRCLIADANFYADWTNVEPVPGAFAYWKKQPGQFKLLTKHSQFKGVYPHNSYFYVGGHTSTASQLDMSFTSQYISSIYLKNRLIDFWQDFSTKQRIRFEFYNTNGGLVMWQEYNAIGTTSTTWFSRVNIRNSSYTDLLSTATIANVWQMFYTDGNLPLGRAFYISRNFGGCPNDNGWSMVGLDQFCTWEQSSLKPMFLYVPGTSYGLWQNVKRTADVMIVRMSFD